MTAIRSPALWSILLCLCGASSAWARALGAPVAVDSAALVAQPYGEQTDVRISLFDGGAFLVWNDLRTGGIWPDVRGIRIGLDGGVLDPDALIISGGPLAQQSPDVACGDSSCLVVWVNGGSDIEAARFGFDGARLDAAPLLLRTTPRPDALSVGSNGTQFLVAWGQSTNLELQLVREDGSPSGPVVALARGGLITSSAIASDRNGFEIAWSEAAPPAYNTRCVKFTPPGSFSAGPQILTTSNQPTTPDVAAAGPAGGYLVAWHTLVTGGANDVLAKELDSAGVQSGGTLTISNGFAFDHPSLSFDGMDWQIIFGNSVGGIDWRTVDQDGGRSALTPVAQITAPHRAQLAMASPDRGLLAWTDDYGSVGGGNLRHAQFARGALSPEYGVATLRARNNQTNPAIAYGSGAFFIVWEDDRSGRQQLWASRLSETGQPLTPPFAVSPSSTDQLNPKVAFDGQAFLVVWGQTTATQSLRGVRIAPDGTPLGAPFVLSDDAYGLDTRAAVAVGPDATYVIWNVQRVGNADLNVMRVLRDGGLLDAVDTPLMVTPQTETHESAAFGPAGLCVAYSSAPPRNVRLSCFDQSLQPRFPGGVAVATSEGYWTALTTTPDRLWTIYGTQAPTDALYAVALDFDGGVSTRAEVLTTTQTPYFRLRFQAQPSAAFDGVALAVAHEQVTLDGGSDVMLRRFHADGGALEIVPLADSVEEERFPAIASSTPGRLGVVYSAFDPSAQRMRLLFRTFADVPLGDSCASSAECSAAAACVAGRCGGAQDGGDQADAGEVTDGGPAAEASDGGTLQARSAYGVGCGCASAPLGAGVIALALLLLRRGGR